MTYLFRRISIFTATLGPVIPGPLELKITQMIGKPSRKAFNTGGLHRADPIEEELSGLGEHLRNIVGLKLAQLDKQRTVEDLNMSWFGQLKQLSE